MNFQGNPVSALKHLEILECFHTVGFNHFGSFVKNENLLTSDF